jgi:hypothetical protein
MGLWTLGQQGLNPKRNPIASILQEELDITSQQGKKILEQRQKIREVCSNLKEVSTYSLPPMSMYNTVVVFVCKVPNIALPLL